MIKKVFFSCFLFLIVYSCIGLIGDNKEEEYPKVWVNNDYFECIEKHLPCKCSATTQIPFLILLEKNRLLLINNSLMSDELDVSKKDDGEFIVYYTDDDDLPSIEVKVEQHENLFFSMYGVQSLYIPYNSEGIYDERNTLIKLNLEGLNKLMSKSGFSFIGRDSLLSTYGLICNQELGEINLLYDLNDCRNKFILEEHGETIEVYKYLNACAPKRVPTEIEKRRESFSK